jgi:TonB family protein
VEALEARLAQLQGELEQRGPAAVPTPPAEVAAAPEDVAASTTGTQPPSPEPNAVLEAVPPEALGPRVGAAPQEAEAAVAPSIVPPVLVRITKPRYPVAARGMRREAEVELRVRVNAGGRVVSVEPVGEPVGLGFDFEARQAAWSAVYKPGTVDGVPTEQETTLTVRFRLDQ